MKRLCTFFLLCSLTAVSWAAGQNQEPVKIGMLTTLTTPGGYLGRDVKDAFALAIKEEGGKLGGVPVELIIADDELKPATATQLATRMIAQDKVDILTGTIFSNVAMAIAPKIAREEVFYISPNAGPSPLAGRQCHKNFFNVAWQNDNLHEAAGKVVNDDGHQRVFILAPNYAAGKDALAGFKRYYSGDIVGEIYTILDQQDYSAELAQIRNAEPDAVFFFLPGGMGINFVKQFAQAGLKDTVRLYGPAFSFDAVILNAVADAAVGVFNTAQWNADLDNAANKHFVEAYRREYNREPTIYASQGYDAAKLIASALQATGGHVHNNMDEFRAALEAANFASVRGDFRFNNNHFPIQDIYVRQVVKAADGVIHNITVKKVFTSHGDAYAADCQL